MRTPYKMIGADAPTSFAGLSTGFKVFFIIFAILTICLLVTYGGIIGWTTVDWKNRVGGLRDDLTEVNNTLTADLTEVNDTLTADLVLVNTTLCDKIMEGDAFLQAQLNAINLGDLNMTLGTTLSDLNDTLNDSITILNTTLSARIAAALVSINNVTGLPNDMGLLNLALVAQDNGIEITSDAMVHEIRVKNTGIVTVNSVTSLSGSNDLLVTGMGMITVNSFPMSSTIEVDGTALSTALSNLQMQVNMQQMEIAVLEGNVTNLQAQISNIQMVGDMIAQDLNGTTVTFNMTLMELVMDVMTLQSTVVSLQAQIDALNNASGGGTVTGTIVPFGGTIIPTDYLLCDGTQYSTATYPDLFVVVGTMYCPGPCSMGMFAVPDLRGKVPAGQGGTALSGTIGSSVGTETHTLSSAEMPVHTHTGTTSFVGDHTHGYSLPQLVGGYSSFADGQQGILGSFNTGGAGAHSHTMNLNNAGSGASHNNIQPSLIVKYMIKT